MLGCEIVSVYQFFYQSKEDFEKMQSHTPKLFIIPPTYDVNDNITTFQYDLGKSIPLQLIIDVFEQSKYFRLRVGQLMRLIEIFIDNLLIQREKGMFNHDLDPQNIWIIFRQGSLGPTFNDKIDFSIQLQGRWKKQEIDNYNDKIYGIVHQIAKNMDKSIPRKQLNDSESLYIQKLKKEIQNLFPMVSLQQLLDEIKTLHKKYQQQNFKIRQHSLFNKRKNRISNAQSNIQGIFNNANLVQTNDAKFHYQSMFQIIIQHLIDFTKHFSQQLKDMTYSDFKKSNYQEFIDFNTFNSIQDKITDYHPFKIGQLDRLQKELILQAFAKRGYLNYPNNQIDPSVKISSLIKDLILFSLSETQKINMHFIQYFKIDKDISYIQENCRIQICCEIKFLLINNDVENFQNNQDVLAQFQEKIFKQYSNKVSEIINHLF